MGPSTIGLAVVGYGYWGPNLVRNFSNTEDVKVIAVADRDPRRLASAARAHPGVETTVDFRALLQDTRIDAVAIATPVSSHYELALAALKAGKHVLVEKPIAPRSDHVQHLIDEAARADLVLMVDHTFLYTPAVQKIHSLIKAGDLGDVLYYNSTRASLGLFQSDVSVIWDLAVHDLSIIEHLFPEGPIAVSATGVSHIAGSPENMAHLTLHFADRCVAHIAVNWLSPVKIRQTLIGGTRKMIVYDDLESTEKIKVYDKGVTLDSAPDREQMRIGYRAGDMYAPHLPATEALHAEAEHFVACIREGITPLSDGVSGLRVVELLEAASFSIAARGSPIPLNQLHRRDRKLELRKPRGELLPAEGVLQ